MSNLDEEDASKQPTGAVVVWIIGVIFVAMVIYAILSDDASGQSKPKAAPADTLVTRTFLIEQRERAIASRQRLIQQYREGEQRAEAEIVGLRFQIQSYRNHVDSLIRVNKSELLEE